MKSLKSGLVLIASSGLLLLAACSNGTQANNSAPNNTEVASTTATTAKTDAVKTDVTKTDTAKTDVKTGHNEGEHLHEEGKDILMVVKLLM